MFFSSLMFSFLLILFHSILFSDTLFFSEYKIINILIEDAQIWTLIKYVFIVSSFFSNIIIFTFLFSLFDFSEKDSLDSVAPIFGLLIGKDLDNHNVYISEESLYQNILITGSIGCGKTSSAMYPFTKQLIEYQSNDISKKLAFLILDVKGNYYSKVLDFARMCNRNEDVIVIQLDGKYKYNPLDKPNIKSSVLANRLKNILLLFSPNNTESYWLDKVEQILESCINFCRIYNNNYVTFEELHNLVISNSYFQDKILYTRNIFLSGNLSTNDCYLLFHSINFLENDYFSLDSRTFNILKSEITRITNCFVSDYSVKNTFCPSKSDENFYGFESVIKSGKIVVLNMNIAQYRNLSKIIAAYLKLDFQTDVLKQLSNSSTVKRSSVFISDEYQEYVTSSDSNFFSQSRESKCINIVSTQSYTSIVNALNNTNSSKVIIQSFVNKIWFRNDDIFTIEEIQKQIGKEEKKKYSRTISENAKESNYGHFSKDFISTNSSLSESINSYYQNDFVYDYNYFTQKLDTFTCLSFLSSGKKILKPQQLKMLPYFLSNN